MPWRYTLRWKAADGQQREQSRTVMSLQALADHLADEVRAILLSGGSDIHIERKKA